MIDIDLYIKPDEEEPEAAEILVDGVVGGRAYRFLLDTGAARSSLVLDDYTAAFAETGSHASSGVFAAHRSSLVRVPSIALGPIARNDFILTRMTSPNAAMHNMIGMDLLKDHRFHFFFAQNRVEVDPVIEAGTNLEDLFLDSKFHPYVDVQFGAEKASAVWDTGAGITVVDQALIHKHPGFFQPVGQSKGSDAAGASMEAATYQMSSVVIGGQIFPPHRVAAVDLSHVNASTERCMDLIIGYSTMRKAEWIFDFPGKKWWVGKVGG